PRCLRFAGWVAPPPRKTRFWLLVQLCQAGFIPAGFQRKVSEFKSLPPSQSLPDARTPYLTPKKIKHVVPGTQTVGQGCGVLVQALRLDLLDVRDAPLKDPAQDVNRHLVAIVEPAHHDEYLGPFRAIEGETQVVEDRVGLEQVAVVLGNTVERVALVDRAEEELKGLPRGQAGNPHEGRVLQQVSVGKQAPILSEGDEKDSVQQALGRLDRPVQLGHALGLKLFDQLDPALG